MGEWWCGGVGIHHQYTYRLLPHTAALRCHSGTMGDSKPAHHPASQPGPPAAEERALMEDTTTCKWYQASYTQVQSAKKADTAFYFLAN